MVFMQIQNVEEDDKNAMRAVLGNQLYSYRKYPLIIITRKALPLAEIPGMFLR